MTYTLVLFVLVPLVILSGMALAPGIDAIAKPLTAAFGGRQFRAASGTSRSCRF